MAQSPHASFSKALAALGDSLGGLFDPGWYAARYRDVPKASVPPIEHFLNWGLAEGRNPNRWFDGAWYAEHYADVGASGMLPLLHYLQCGAAELRNPHPRFDAAWYAEQHPEAARNPLLHHLRVGAARGYLTEKPIDIRDYLPSEAAPLSCPDGVAVDVVIPVYAGLDETQRCLNSVLADPDRPPGRVIVIDDRSPEPALSAWLKRLAADGRITLLRNRRNLGFVASANRGMQEAGAHDVALLNSDTEVPPGWLLRLAAQAYAVPRIASVSPFSNNATICGYPGDESGDIPFGMHLDALDALCREVNAGRSVELPTTVGFCMYIRRAALNAIGMFDEQSFGRGYGEENDFCMRAAAAGWRHMLACDTFVYHRGAVSFGPGTERQQAAMHVLEQRYPDYRTVIARHVTLDVVGPSRFAVTAALFARSGLPVILLVSHRLGGGVQRHIGELVQQLSGRAHVVLLESTARGAALSAPELPGHPELALPAERIGDLVTWLRACNVARAHVHHLLGMDLDVRKLLHRLGVPFDVTVHDYFALCPQVNLLPWREAHFCGLPGPAVCNACIADTPSHGARDILGWRSQFAWLFRDADRVFCPSEDTRARLAQYGLAERAVVVPHEPVPPGAWTLNPPRLRGNKLRIAVLGVLAPQKGAHTVMAVAEAADSSLEFHLIGHPEEGLPDIATDRLTVTGKYEEAELPALLGRVKPHVVWFPAQWPETYSYTLSAALDAGVPVVASRIGAFPERLAGRKLSWLVDPRASTEEWLATFDAVRVALRQPVPRIAAEPAASEPFYPDRYLQPAAPAVRHSLLDLRRPGRIAVVMVPERLENSALSPCAYIRLLLPLDHPDAGADCDFVVADAETAQRYRADVVVTQRYGLPSSAAADAVLAHCRATGARLLYDLDDDLLHIPPDHPEAGELQPRAKLIQRLIRAADAVWVSTPGLARRLDALRPDAVVVPNGLDERLWGAYPPGRGTAHGPVRLLCMGTMTHQADFALIQPALDRLKQDFGGRVEIDMLGFTDAPDLPDWLNRLSMPVTAQGSYPGFVNWIAQQPGWDIGLAPLADTPFNRSKSSIKALDYAALGLAVVASELDVYRASVAARGGGELAANRPEDWYAALSRLLRDAELRHQLGRTALELFRAEGTLASQAEQRRTAWRAVAQAPAARARRNGARAAA